MTTSTNPAPALDDSGDTPTRSPICPTDPVHFRSALHARTASRSSHTGQKADAARGGDTAEVGNVAKVGDITPVEDIGRLHPAGQSRAAYPSGAAQVSGVAGDGEETGADVRAVADDLDQGGADMNVERDRSIDRGAVEAVVIDARDASRKDTASVGDAAEGGTSGWFDGAGGFGGGGTVRCTETPPRYRGADSLHVDDPGELIVAVPAMVGFVPERSLVVAVLGGAPAAGHGPIIDAVVRFDLDPEGGRRRGLAAAFAECVSRICEAEGASEVLAVIVDDRVREPRRNRARAQRGAGVGPWGTLIVAFARRLAAEDVVLGGAWAVRAIEAEQRWWSLPEADRRGVLPDPAASMVTVAHVLDGRPIRGSRAELTGLVAQDAQLSARVAQHLEAALAAEHSAYAAAVRRSDPDSYHRRALEQVLWQIANIDSGAELSPREFADLAAMLRHRVIRDALFALAVGDHAGAAEQLWVAMSRALSGADRADAAALLGYSAYIRGDGPFAGVALQTALDAAPHHAMAGLLDVSLRTGMRPESLRRLARCGLGIAADLGVDLGPIIR